MPVIPQFRAERYDPMKQDDPRVASVLRWLFVLTTALCCVRLYGAGEYAWAAAFGALAFWYNPFLAAFGFSETRPVAAIATVSLALALVTVPLPATAAPQPDLSNYRGFQLGASLAEVAKLAQLDASQAKAIHSRPALIQELEWMPTRTDPASRAEAVKSVYFRFYKGELFQILVNYDSYETEGLTADDVIDAISANYGPARRHTASAEAAVPYSIDGESLARWEDPAYRLDLIRFSYGPSYRLVCVSRKNEELARAAAEEATRLDEREAPQREVERLAAEEALKRSKADKARSANRPRFRP